MANNRGRKMPSRLPWPWHAPPSGNVTTAGGSIHGRHHTDASISFSVPATCWHTLSVVRSHSLCAMMTFTVYCTRKGARERQTA